MAKILLSARKKNQTMMYEYTGEVVRVVDGDTIVLKLSKEFPVEIDFGFYIKDTMILKKSAQMSFRLLGVDTAELVGGTSETKLLAQQAKSKVEELTVGKKLRVLTEKPDKYGRWLATIYVEGEAISLNETLLNLGLATVYK